MPAGFKADEKNMKAYYAVAYIRHFMNKHPDTYLPYISSVKRHINEAY